MLYSDLETRAAGIIEVFTGTSGSVIERRNAQGFPFYAHQFYDAERKKRERYVAGPIGSADAELTASRLRERIEEAQALTNSLRLLGREGFCLADRRAYATVATLHNAGVFSAGGMLIGSHAYGVLLNRLGIRSQPYATEDVDIARPSALKLAVRPAGGLLEILQRSGIDFVEVPQLDRRAPATSFKARGRSLFQVDLLVPSAAASFPIVAVPELQAHAVGLPYLGYLLGASQMGLLIAREGGCIVRVPLTERFAIHKLLVSQLRVGRGAKAQKDVLQAAVLAAALADSHPGALEEAADALPRSARKLVRTATRAVRPHLEFEHTGAWEVLAGV